MIRRHTPPPKRPSEKAVDEQFAAYLRWQQQRLSDPTDPSRSWPPEREEAHLAQTWPALQQLRVWSRWYNQQPVRQGPVFQSRGATVERSILWVALWGVVGSLASFNLARADTPLVTALAGLTVGIAIGLVAVHLIGLYWQVRECDENAPTYGDTRAHRYAEAVRFLEERGHP